MENAGLHWNWRRFVKIIERFVKLTHELCNCRAKRCSDHSMTDETTSNPLILTKLHRPPVPTDHVHRPELLAWLEKRRRRPLTLVSAPAGYGKSTPVSCWLDTRDSPGAWLSLDEHDNDLRLFLSYFLAAVQTIFPVPVTSPACWRP